MATSVQVQTLVFVRNDDKVLLGRKKRNFAKGTWNGYGGKAAVNETPSQCAVRELQEESGLVVSEENLHYVGVLKVKADVQFGNDRDVYIYTVDFNDCTQQLEETEEMTPKWFDIDALPYEDMLPDAKEWFPLLFEGKRFDVMLWLYGNSYKHEIHFTD